MLESCHPFFFFSIADLSFLDELERLEEEAADEDTVRAEILQRQKLFERAIARGKESPPTASAAGGVPKRAAAAAGGGSGWQKGFLGGKPAPAAAPPKTIAAAPGKESAATNAPASPSPHTPAPTPADVPPVTSAAPAPKTAKARPAPPLLGKVMERFP